MKLLIQYLSVAGAGALGAVARLFVGSICGAIFGDKFPVGTFVINISGSLLLGWFLAFAQQRTGISDTIRLAIAVGFVGAYTTFSTFMAESNSLMEIGATARAITYLVGSLAIGLIAVRFGLWLGARAAY
jgi:fluoride exporter